MKRSELRSTPSPSARVKGHPMDAKRHGIPMFVSLALTACATLALGMFATAATADPGNGNGSANGNAFRLSNGNNGQADTHQTTGNAGTSGTPTSAQPLSNADNNG